MKLNKSLLITTALSIGITTPSYSKTDTSKLIEPIFESITATFQDDSFEKGQLSKAIISAKISNVINEKNAESFKGTIFEIVDDGGNKVILRDDGKGVDKRAKDGIFNALGMLDPHFILSRKERFAQLENSKTKPVILELNGREIISRTSPEEILRRPQVGKPILIRPTGNPSAVTPEASLVITHPDVVQDTGRTYNTCTNTGTPGGVWTFRYLMEQMRDQSNREISASDFTMNWLNKWRFNQVVNNFPVNNRNTGMMNEILDDWIAASVGTDLDLDKAPFQLLGFFNRVDLRGSSSYGGGSAGEGRLVFGLIDPNTCQGKPMTVIFEYGVAEKMSCPQVKAWGQRWVDLDNHRIGGDQYNAALESITRSFTDANASPSKPNGSSLNQIRTNDFALGRPWELREFVIGSSGHLVADTVKQTPDISFNRTQVLADYVNTNTTAILNGSYQVPLYFPTPLDPFLGGSALTPNGMVWTDSDSRSSIILNREARHQFSLNSCNGCHAGETKNNLGTPTPFVHISPTSGIPARLSPFMTGVTVPDPVDGVPSRTFNEFDRRAADLDDLVNSSCFIRNLSTVDSLRRSNFIH